MPHEVYVKEGEHFIRVRAHGHIRKSDILQAEKDALAFHVENELDNVLIDHRDVESFVGTMDIFDLGARLPQSPFRRIAMVVNEIHENYQFLETVAVNRGGNLKMFTSEEAALAWVSGSTQGVRQLGTDNSK